MLFGRDFIRLQDFDLTEIEMLLNSSRQLKVQWFNRQKTPILEGSNLFAIFFNPSLRTRASFETAANSLGSNTVFMEPSTMRVPVLEGEDRAYQTERIADVAKVLSGMGNAIAIRVLGDAVNWEYEKGYQIIKEFARYSDVPVINLEDNIYHPCQGLADLLTLQELFGNNLRGCKIGVGWVYSPSTSKPIAPHHDFLYIASLMGAEIVFAHPPSLTIDPEIEQLIRSNSRIHGGSYRVSHNLEDAFEDADVIYAKNYVCLDLLPPKYAVKQNEEMEGLFSKFKDWIVDSDRIRLAKSEACYLHCLPCDRNHEVTDEILDGVAGNTVYSQAHNRLHAQRGILTSILGN